jgi:hypothetical protein
MNLLRRDEIIDLERYTALRAGYRQAVIAHKKSRRLAVGEMATLVFEDRETLRFQVQEMLYIERIAEAAGVQTELDVYNELMPGPGELSATLFLEITEAGRIRPELDRLLGIDEHVALVVGGDGEESEVGARFDPSQLEDDRISAVHYLKFPLGAAADRFADPAVPARIRIDHPHYRREAAMPPDLRASLIAGLARDPEPLLRGGGPERAGDDVVFTEGFVRARRVDAPPGADHVIVEPLRPRGSLLSADPAVLAALQDAVRRVAAALVRRHGACRVETRVSAEDEGLRWHVIAPAP